MAAEGAPEETVRRGRYLDMRYVGQSYSLAVGSGAPMDASELARCVAQFHLMHEERYGYHNESAPVEVVNVRAVQSAEASGSNVWTASGDGGAKPSAEPARRAYFREVGEYIECPVLQRGSMEAGARLVGPAIIEQADTTTVLYPGHEAEAGTNGIIIVRTGRS